MKKSSEAVSVIGGVDGPTSVFLLKRKSKLTLKQRIEKFKHTIKKTYVEKTLKSKSHTIDEVMAYIVNVHGFVELDKNSDEVKEEYKQMRASFIMQYASELLGEYAEIPQLESDSMKEVQDHLEKIRDRMQKASEISTVEFDIDFHKFQKSFDDINDNIHIVIEKRFAYLGGGAAGSKKVIKKFKHIYKDIYRYYGVTKEDIRIKSERYKDVVQALSQ